ncbi:WD40/YVTN/BNR-like repeat-containing protein [Bacteroidota bacterium]
MFRKFFILSVILLILTGNFVFCQESPLLASWEEYKNHKKNTPYNLEWIQLGPVINSARLDAIQIVPDKPGTMYAAFGSGNLWKTINNGLTWKPIFEDQSALGIGDVTIAPSNSDIIWVGTGESLKKPRLFTMPGTGVFKSSDAGETWENMGLPDSYSIGEVAIHPTDPDIVLVAVLGHLWTTNENRGIYRTENGGKTWDHVLYINEKTGANDIVIAHSDPNIMYASSWENNPGTFGKESGIYKSDDAGKTWNKCTDGLPDGPKTGRIGLAVSYSNPNKAYALIDNFNAKKNYYSEFYCTTDGGKTWKRTHKNDINIAAGLGWYFSDCYVNPQDDDEIYGLGVNIGHSSDGGKTFDLIAGDVYHIFPTPADALHVDNCELWINPLNPSHIALANDGGLYVSYDKCKTWMHYNNIPAGEFYDISVDNQNPYMIYGGVQDDASVYGPSQELKQKFPDGWKYIWIDSWSGGDGCYTFPDPEDPNTVYFSSQYGGAMRKDMKADRSKSIKPRDRQLQKKLNYHYTTAFFISPFNHLTLYHAGNYVYKSVNRGDSWRRISEDLSESSIETKKSFAVGAIAESPLKQGLIFAGTDKGGFWFTENDGYTWEENSTGLPDYYIRSIYPSGFEEGRVFIAISGINEDNLDNHLYMTNDYGKSWESIKGNLPNEIANVIIEDPINEDILYAGLYRGVYISTNRGRSWSLMGTNMAATCISDLVIHKNTMDLVVGTHGRGIYKMNLKVIHDALRDNIENENILFDIPKATLPWINDTHRDPKYSTMEKVAISFYLAKGGKVKIELLDNKDKAIWETDFQARKGINQYRWDLITKQVYIVAAYFNRSKQFVRPGKYTVKISNKNFEISNSIEIVKRSDPVF